MKASYVITSLVLMCNLWAGPETGGTPVVEGKESKTEGKITVEAKLVAIPKGNTVNVITNQRQGYLGKLTLEENSIVRYLPGDGPGKLLPAKKHPHPLRHFEQEYIVIRGLAKTEFPKGVNPIKILNSKQIIRDEGQASFTVDNSQLPHLKGATIKVKAIARPKAVYLEIQMFAADQKKVLVNTSFLVRRGTPVLVLGLAKESKNLLLRLDVSLDKNIDAKLRKLSKVQLLDLRLRTMRRDYGGKATLIKLSSSIDFMMSFSSGMDHIAKRLNIVLSSRSGAVDPLLKVNLENVYLSDMLKDISKQAGLKIENDGYAILLGDFYKLKRPKQQSELEKRLETVCPNTVSFQDASLLKVLDHYEFLLKKLDPKGERVTITLVNKHHKRISKVSIFFWDLPVNKALEYICRDIGCTLEYKKDTVIVTVP